MDELERELLNLRDDERVTIRKPPSGDGLWIMAERLEKNERKTVSRMVPRNTIEQSNVDPLAFELKQMRKDLDE